MCAFSFLMHSTHASSTDREQNLNLEHEDLRFLKFLRVVMLTFRISFPEKNSAHGRTFHGNSKSNQSGLIKCSCPLTTEIDTGNLKGKKCAKVWGELTESILGLEIQFRKEEEFPCLGSQQHIQATPGISFLKTPNIQCPATSLPLAPSLPGTHWATSNCCYFCIISLMSKSRVLSFGGKSQMLKAGFSKAKGERGQLSTLVSK